MVHSLYPQRQGSGDIFQYSVDAIVGLGFSTTMSYANSGFAIDYDGQNFGSTPTTFTELLQTTPYTYLFAQAIPRHIFQLWTFANGPASDPPAIQASSAQLQNEYQEVYDACVYLLTTYSDKEFIIKNWEGDWQLLTVFDPTQSIDPYRPGRYAAFANARQRAVRDARRDTPSTSKIIYCVELNRCLDDFDLRLHRDVLPFVNPDMVGWSAYEAINYWVLGWELVAAVSNQTADVTALAYGNGIAVAVTKSGGLSMSPDGQKWYPRDAGFGASDINGVVYVAGLGLWVAVGAGGKIATSPDALTWTQQTSSTAQDLSGVITNGTNQVIAFGATAAIVSSANGTAWAAPTWTGGVPTTTWTVGTFTGVNSWYVAGTGGKAATGFGTAVQQFTINFGTDNVNALTTSADGLTLVFGGDAGKISYATVFDSSATAATSQFGSDAILSLAFGQNKFVAVGTSGKISTGTADGTSWAARTAGTGAYLRAVTYSLTENVWAYGCDGATGYSLDGITWIVNGQGALGGAIVYHMLSAPGLVVTGSNAGLLTTATHWHVQTNAEDNIDYYVRKGVDRIRDHVPAGTPIAITEYGFPHEQSNFTGIGLDVGRLIQKVIDTAAAVGLVGVIWWQIFDNEEQSPGVPRGFCLYDRDGSNTVSGPLSPAGVKYDAIL